MKKLIVTLTAVFIGSVVSFGQEWSDVWEFNDAADTPINLAANTGTSGMLKFDQKNPDDGPPTGGFTDGAGLFVVSGDSSQSFRQARIDGYGGVLTVEWVIKAWELDSKDLNQSQSYRSAGVRLRDVDAAVNVIHFQLNQQGSGNVRIRYSWEGEGNWTVVLDALEQVSSAEYVVLIKADIEAGTFSISINGSEVGSGTAAGMAGINSLSLYSQGAYQVAPYEDDFVKYDSLKFNATVIPTPTWAGYEVDELGWVDTLSWLGYLNVLADPWIWSASFNNWMYMPEGSVGEGGSWAYVISP
jgi:hypothetical protein